MRTTECGRALDSGLWTFCHVMEKEGRVVASISRRDRQAAGGRGVPQPPNPLPPALALLGLGERRDYVVANTACMHKPPGRRMADACAVAYE